MALLFSQILFFRRAGSDMAQVFRLRCFMARPTKSEGGWRDSALGLKGGKSDMFFFILPSILTPKHLNENGRE